MGGRVVFREWFRKLSLPRKLSRRGSIWRACLESVSKIRGVCRAHVKHRTPDRPMKKGFLLIIFVNTVFFSFSVKFYSQPSFYSFQIQVFFYRSWFVSLGRFFINNIIYNMRQDLEFYLDSRSQNKYRSAKYIYILILRNEIEFIKNSVFLFIIMDNNFP